MAKRSKGGLVQLGAGLIAAILFTFLGMLLISALLVYAGISDSLLTWLNQLLKILAVVIGTSIAVPRGSENGLARGAVLALIYMLLGYALYVGLGGSFRLGSLLGELLIGCAAGAITGAVRANLPSKRSGRKSRYIST